jgi:hypothetical protein
MGAFLFTAKQLMGTFLFAAQRQTGMSPGTEKLLKNRLFGGLSCCLGMGVTL